MRKRLKKKLFKKQYKTMELYSMYNIQQKLIRNIDRNSFVFIPKQKSKSKYTSIIQKVFNEDIKDKWLNFNNIIIDECYIIEIEHT